VGKKKLQRFAENLTFGNLFQPSFKDLEDGFVHKGKWHDYFENNNPITLELGCGKGEYSVGLASMNPERNYIGIDIKGARLWKGCKLSDDLGLKNVAFIRTRIEMIEKFFKPGEVKELYITFPDPQPKRIKERKRLTSDIFLRRYMNILAPDHIVHLKTDDIHLFEYTLGLIREGNHQLIYSTDDVYKSDCPHEIRGIQTFYEQKWLEEGKKITYIAFKINPL
jgi:tRNA (guanine-N7-)-methyltransferase